MRRSITVLAAAAACALWAAGPASAATTWVIQATPNPADATSPELNGISCHSSTNCVAVGFDRNATTDISQTLTEHWNGSTWKIQTPRSLPRSSNAQLWGVACPSARSCIAVGQITNSSDFQAALAEHWNGSAWTTQTVHNPAAAASGSLLFGISCSSATSCTAVGYQLPSAWDPAPEPLAEHWNGSTWTIQTTPIPSGSDAGSLQAVSCVSATSCTAVGYAYGSSYPLALLVEHWNGSTWTIQTTPHPAGSNEDTFNAVSCRSATACTATGFAGSTADSASTTLAEHWNGRTWTIESTPNPADSPTNLFNGVSCVSSTTCSAVGFNVIGPLAERS
jgi:hypothetical protein